MATSSISSSSSSLNCCPQYKIWNKLEWQIRKIELDVHSFKNAPKSNHLPLDYRILIHTIQRNLNSVKTINFTTAVDEPTSSKCMKMCSSFKKMYLEKLALIEEEVTAAFDKMSSSNNSEETLNPIELINKIESIIKMKRDKWFFQNNGQSVAESNTSHSVLSSSSALVPFTSSSNNNNNSLTATGKKKKKPPSHAPTTTLVLEAISNLKERKGSSLHAIKRYITEIHKVDAEKLSPFIRKSLKSCVEKGILLQPTGQGAAGSFKLAPKFKQIKKPSVSTTTSTSIVNSKPSSSSSSSSASSSFFMNKTLKINPSEIIKNDGKGLERVEAKKKEKKMSIPVVKPNNVSLTSNFNSSSIPIISSKDITAKLYIPHVKKVVENTTSDNDKLFNKFPQTTQNSIQKFQEEEETTTLLDSKDPSTDLENDDVIESIPPPNFSKTFQYDFDIPECDHMDNWNMANDFFGQSVSKNEMLNKLFIQFHDDRVLESEGPLILIREQQQQPQRQNDEEEIVESNKSKINVFHQKLKIIKSKILKEELNEFGMKKKKKSLTIGLDVRDFNLFYTEPQDFFSFFSNFITHFHFGQKLFSGRLIRENVLLDLIMEKLPNLEYLAINDVMLDNWDSTNIITTHSSRKSSQYILPNLKILRFIQTKFGRFSRNFIRQILKSVPNLETIYGLPCQYVGLVEEREWMARCGSQVGVQTEGILKSVSGLYHTGFESWNTDFALVGFLNTMSRMKSTSLEELDIRYTVVGVRFLGSGEEENWKITRMRQLYLNLLRSNQLTLKKLSLRPLGIKGGKLEYTNEQFKIPPLVNLTYLQIYFESFDATVRIFPSGWNVQEIFPNVTCVEIKYSDKCGSVQGSFTLDVFRPGQVFQNVTHLKLTSSDQMRWMWTLSDISHLVRIFGNVTKLTLRSDPISLHSCLGLMFGSWPKIKELQLEIDLGPAYCLDMALLGMTEKTYETLKKDGFPVLTKEELGNYRNYPSICSLKELKLFRIKFYNSGDAHTLDLSQHPLFTQISRTYGWSFMDELSVFIGMDDSCSSSDRIKIMSMLSSIQSYITIEA